MSTINNENHKITNYYSNMAKSSSQSCKSFKRKEKSQKVKFPQTQIIGEPTVNKSEFQKLKKPASESIISSGISLSQTSTNDNLVAIKKQKTEPIETENFINHDINKKLDLTTNVTTFSSIETENSINQKLKKPASESIISSGISLSQTSTNDNLVAIKKQKTEPIETENFINHDINKKLDLTKNVTTTSHSTNQNKSLKNSSHKISEIDLEIKHKSEFDDYLNEDLFDQDNFNETFKNNVENFKQESVISDSPVRSQQVEISLNALNNRQLGSDEITSSNDDQLKQKDFLNEKFLDSNKNFNSNVDKTILGLECSTDKYELNASERHLSLSEYQLSDEVLNYYKAKGINKLFQWQYDCLHSGNVLDGENLVFTAPTSAGKTIVLDILLIRSIQLTQKKGIIVLPYISLANEKVVALEQMLKYSNINVGGFMGNSLPSGRFPAVNVAVCTIEKANNIINKLIQEKKLEEVGIIIVDELHEIGVSERGSLLEQLLTKIKFLKSKIQIVGTSATLPNYQEIASWLNAQAYSTQYRPIPLRQLIKEGNLIKDLENDEVVFNIDDIRPPITQCGDMGHTLTLVLQTIISGNGVLVFCESKLRCEKLATTLAIKIGKLTDLLNRDQEKLNELLNKSQSGVKQEHIDAAKILKNHVLKEELIKEIKEQLSKCPSKLDPALSSTISNGIAFHHAGLSMDERNIIENGFKEGVIKAIFATPTLSSGVNLPARRVVISSLKVGREYLPKMTYLQMVGRAGRKGIDDRGESILITNNKDDLKKGKELMVSELGPIKSKSIEVDAMGKIRINNSFKRLTSEAISNKIITTFEEIKLYLNSTFFSITKRLDDHEVEEIINNLMDEDDAPPFIQVIKDGDKASYLPSKLGSAILASSLSPDEAIRLYKEFMEAMNGLVLNCDLHLLFYVIPTSSLETRNINWRAYFQILIELTEQNKPVENVLKILKIDISFISNLALSNISKKEDNVMKRHIRFYYALALNEIMSEKPLDEVCKIYGLIRGDLQTLQQRSSSFCGMLSIFCKELGWESLSLIIKLFQDRLYFGINPELIDLMNIPCLNAKMARCLYESDLKDCKSVAHSKSVDIQKIILNYLPIENTSKKIFWVSIKCQTMSTEEISELIIQEARLVIEEQAGGKLKWEYEIETANSTANSSQPNKFSQKQKYRSPFRKKSRRSNSKLSNRSFNRSNKRRKLADSFEKDITDNTVIFSENETDQFNNQSKNRTIRNSSNSEFEIEFSGSDYHETPELNSGVLANLSSDHLCSSAEEVTNFEMVSQSPENFAGHNTDVELFKSTDEDSESYQIHNYSNQEGNESLNLTISSSVGNIESNLKKLDNKTFYDSFYDKKIDEGCFKIIDQIAKDTCQEIDRTMDSNKNFKYSVNKMDNSKITSFIQKFESAQMFSIHFKLSSRIVVEKDFVTNNKREVQDVKVTPDWIDKIEAICIQFDKKKIYYFDSNQSAKLLKTKINENTSFKFSNKLILAVSWDLKKSFKILKACFQLSDDNLAKIYWHDAKVAHWLLDPDANEPENLLDISEKYLEARGSLTFLENSKKEIKLKPELEDITTIGLLYPIMSRLKRELQEKKLYESYMNIELPVLIIFAKNELNGFTLNVNTLTSAYNLWIELSKNLDNLISERLRKEKIYIGQSNNYNKGFHLNVRHNKDVRYVLEMLNLYEKIGLNPKLEKSTGKEVLDKMRVYDDFAGYISEARKLLHMFDVKKDLNLECNSVSGKVIGTYKHFMATGRIAMFGPNLLGIDNDQEITLNEQTYRLSIRKSLCAKEGYILVTADYCQLELRILTALSKDDNLLQIFKHDIDPFKVISSFINNKKIDEITQSERNATKQIIYSIIYGSGVKKLADSLGLEIDKTRKFLAQFHAAFPKLEPFIKQCKDDARNAGYVETLFGRRRYLPNIKSMNEKLRNADERKAVNSRIQGNASDLVKLAMLKIDQTIKEKKLDAEIILQMHDELIFQVRNNGKNALNFAKLLREEMTSCSFVLKNIKKLPIRIRTGFNWSELYDLVES